jgi:MoxR-like ATPase
MTTERLRLFDPDAGQPPPELPIFRRGDEPPRKGYVYDADGRIALAVNVALVTGRPLLIRGRPGTGKSSLAGDVAEKLGWRFYSRTVTSRTRARDLQWSYDAVRRLNDANVNQAKDPIFYVTPGVLWWAFSTDSAATRGLSDDVLEERSIPRLDDPSPRPGERAVVLLDEIDKADPDLPNDLLTPLGSLQFGVADVEGAPPVKADAPPLVVVTTNEERDLPEAFIRRCVVLTLPDAGPDRMKDVARAHYGDDVDDALLDEVVRAYEGIRSTREAEDHDPSLAEYLDAVGAVVALRALPDGDDRWTKILNFTLKKPAST